MKPIKKIEVLSYCYPSAPDVFDELEFAVFRDGDVVITSAEEDVIISLADLKETVDVLHKALCVFQEGERFKNRTSNLEC